ncbi:MAG: hypothetical protein Q4B26_13230 [Eubacteriales bacterium]|nr:hypothetical protein [Eubacteriales bacterium]
MTIFKNVMVVLGMIGGMTIVWSMKRNKDPIDSVFLLWAAAAGFLAAMGQYLVVVLGSLMMVCLLLILARRTPLMESYILVIQCENHLAEITSTHFIKDNVEKQITKRKILGNEMIELCMEVQLKNNDTEFVNDLSGITGVKKVEMIYLSRGAPHFL